MKIVINGEERVVDGLTTVSDLLGFLGIRPGSVAVEQNLSIVDRRRFDHTALREGDVIEIIRFVGGG